MALATDEHRYEAIALLEQAAALGREPTPAYSALSEDEGLRFALLTILVCGDDGQPEITIPSSLIQKRIEAIIALMVVATEG